MGCCGSKRQQVAQKYQMGTGAHAGARGVAGAMAGAAAGGPASAPLAPASTVQFAASAGVAFVYDGLAELVVTGSASGRRYRFATRGARLMVDARDAPSMRLTPKLRCLA